MTYKIFAGENYYPKGGYEDFQGTVQTLEEAKEYVESQYSGEEAEYWEWAHITCGDLIVAEWNYVDKTWKEK